MTQRELAEAADVSQTTVYELEADRRGAYPKTVRRLARGLNVEAEDLVGQERRVSTAKERAALDKEV